MLAKFLALALLASVSAYPASYGGGGGYGQAEQLAPQQTLPEPEPFHNIDYKVQWAVQDESTFNYQTREENKNGDRVEGSYSVVEPDGSLRLVKYVADANGFVADVENKPGHAAPYQAPQAHYQATPAKYEAALAPAKYEAARYVPLPAKMELAPARYEAPKYQAPKYEAPKLVMIPAKYEAATKFEAPQRYEAPKYEAPKYEAPKYEAPKYEAPKYEAPPPKYEAPKLQQAPQQFSYQHATETTYGTHQPAVQVFSAPPRPAAPKPMMMSDPAKPTYTASAEMTFRPQPATFQQQQQHSVYNQQQQPQQLQLQQQQQQQQQLQTGNYEQEDQSGYDNQQAAAETLTAGKY